MLVQKKYFVHLLMLLLMIFLSFLLSSARPEFMGASVVEKVNYQVLRNREMPKRNLVHANKRRFDIEINDYPGSGANSRHDPRNPGKP